MAAPTKGLRSNPQNADPVTSITADLLAHFAGALSVSGVLAVGVFCLVPLVIPPLFGDRFEPATRLLPLFAVLAIVKGLEIAMYRLLYSVHKQTTYLWSVCRSSSTWIWRVGCSGDCLPHLSTC